VQLDAPFVDVLVRLEDLGADRWELDEEKMRVIASRSGDSIGLGDKLIVEIVDVQILRRTVYGKRIGGGQSERGAGDRSQKKPKFPIYEKKTGEKHRGPRDDERQVRAGKRKVDKHAAKGKGGRKGGKGGRRG
jgi:ribonuclease R